MHSPTDVALGAAETTARELGLQPFASLASLSIPYNASVSLQDPWICSRLDFAGFRTIRHRHLICSEGNLGKRWEVCQHFTSRFWKSSRPKIFFRCPNERKVFSVQGILTLHSCITPTAMAQGLLFKREQEAPTAITSYDLSRYFGTSGTSV